MFHIFCQVKHFLSSQAFFVSNGIFEGTQGFPKENWCPFLFYVFVRKPFCYRGIGSSFFVLGIQTRYFKPGPINKKLKQIETTIIKIVSC